MMKYDLLTQHLFTMIMHVLACGGVYRGAVTSGCLRWRACHLVL